MEIYVDITLLEPEFLHFLQVLEEGSRKYGKYSWLSEDGPKTSHKDMHASMFRHLAESHAGKRYDEETGLDPLLHLAARALMLYTINHRKKNKEK